jgi:hypothetical protein
LSINNVKLKAELAKRAKAVANKKKFSIEDFCFDKQIDFIRDPARFKTAVCSRRAGKSIACAADLINTALTKKGDVAYLTLSRVSAKRIIWRELLKINKDYELGGIPDNTDLSLKMPDGNIIFVSGAKDATDAEKWRGMAFSKIYIDESQAFRAYIQDLIEDILEPALTDYNGSLSLIGTPGPVPAGYFYDAAHNPAWSHHAWTMQQNPHIKLKSGREPIEIIQELANRRGLKVSDASIQREYFGQWIKDLDSLVFKFDNIANICLDIPKNLTYIFGIDIGYKDADAIAVLGYSHFTGKVYLVEELVTSKQDITSLVGQIKALQDKYKPVKMVMDAGALGKKIQEEIRIRHQLPIEAADKHRKFEYIALLNDDLRSGKFQAYPGSRFAEDTNLVQWNYDDPARPKVSDVYHTDIGDAILYAHREAKHYFKMLEPEKLQINSDKYMDMLEQKAMEKFEEAKSGMQEFTDVTNFDDIGVNDDEI